MTSEWVVIPLDVIFGACADEGILKTRMKNQVILNRLNELISEGEQQWATSRTGQVARRVRLYQVDN